MKTSEMKLPEMSYLVTVKTDEGYFELGYTARSVREVREWAAGLDGVTEVVHVTVGQG